MKNLLHWLKPHKFTFLLVIILVIVLPLTYSFVPQFIKYIFDNVLDPKDDASNTLPKFLLNFFNNYQGLTCIIIVSITLVFYQISRALLMFTNGFNKGRLSEGLAKDMRIKLYTHIQNLSYSYHSSVDTGDLIQRCTTDIDTVKQFLANNLSDIIYIITSIVIGGIQMAAININIMFITMGCIPITMIISTIYFRIATKKFNEIEEVEASMTSVLQESVNGVRVVKAFAKEKYEIDRFNVESEKFKNANINMAKYSAKFWGFSDGFIFIQYALTIGYCIYLARKGLSTGDLITCITYIAMLVYPVRNLGRIISNLSKAMVSSKRIAEILNTDDEYVIDGDKTPTITGNIEFKDVCFKFNDSKEEDKYLLKNLSFKIQSGDVVAIVGKTGSGKTTIVNLLTRMMEVSSGDILIDGVSIKDINKHYLRENIRLVNQDPFLYQKTIYENISIANPQATKEMVIEASKIASIHDDILGFDKGYDTLVGEKGVTLSGGQKQRVAIARMILLNKPVIIFDDSLSAVDTKTDLNIRNSLSNNANKLTTILITHRITSAKEANKILVLEDGYIKDFGTHEELSKREGLYKDLWDIQGALEEEFLKVVEKTIKGGVNNA